jgi:hypothetical protein
MTDVNVVFSGEFRERLKLGKYTSWAADLDEEQLRMVLSFVGEFGIRAPELLGDDVGRQLAQVRDLDRGAGRTPYPGDQRRDGALRVLAHFVHGRRPTMEQAREIVFGPTKG